jgi:uncharacterized membrane protein YciS (DUF1049 family)
MRRINGFISLLLIVAIAVGLVAFSLGNGTRLPVWIFGYTFYHVPFWLPTVAGVVIGFLLAFLVLTPGRLHGAWQNSRLRKRTSRHEQELSDMRQRNAELEQHQIRA